MTDACKVVAELRAQELLTALQAAVAGDSHWRHRASALLRSIDARKRAAEVMQDVMWSDCSG